MTFKEFLSLNPLNQFDYVDREEIKTLYSTGSYDGPLCGVIEWKDKRYYASCPDQERVPRIFLIIEIAEDQERLLEEAHKNYASSGATSTLLRNILPARRETAYKTLFKIREETEKNGKIVGFFEDW
jgi:hypothetical protein